MRAVRLIGKFPLADVVLIFVGCGGGNNRGRVMLLDNFQTR